MKKFRLSKEKMISGVIAGLTESLNINIDPNLFRIIIAVLSIFNPALILIYFGMALIMPHSDVNII